MTTTIDSPPIARHNGRSRNQDQETDVVEACGVKDFDTDDRPEWPSQLVKTCSATTAGMIRQHPALHDEVVPDDTFVSAAHQMLAQLRSGSVKISSKSSLMALAHMKQPWAATSMSR